MKIKLAAIGVGFGLAALSWCSTARATPSTHVWTPSTDIQASGTGHITYDSYIPSQNDASGSKPDTVTDIGLEGGYWPLPDKIGIEAGIDNITGYGKLDDYPLYFNAKIGSPEDAFFAYMPALAVGGYNFGTKSGQTNQNIYYVEGARTVKAGGVDLGRVSVGWFWGNDDVLLDSDGGSAGDGVLLTWERTLSEISEKLWICADYQGSDSAMGALAPGLSWKFTDKVALLAGYVIPNNRDLADTFTLQLDIDF